LPSTSALRLVGAQRAGLLAVHRSQRHRVVDQHHGAGSQHGHAGQAGQARQLRPEVLHHHFLVAQHFVDVHRDALRGASEDHHRQRLALRLAAAGDDCSSAPDQKKGTARRRSRACRCCRPAALPWRARGARFHQVGGHADGQLARLRIITTCVTAVVSGSTSLKLVPRPACGGSLDAAAERVDFGAHHVHADAAAGQFRHLLRGGETGQEDQVGGVARRRSAGRA
jgi:hypothetical protein